MNILHLISARHYIGEAARVINLSQTQIEKGHHVVLAVRENHSVASEAVRRGIPFVEAKMSGAFRPWSDLSDVRLIRRLIREHKIDLVHAHRGKDHWLAVTALRGSDLPLIRTRHVVTPIRTHPFNRMLYDRWTDGLICVSRAVEQAVLGSLGPRAGLPMQVIAGGIRPLRGIEQAREDAAALRQHLHLTPETPVLTVLARLAGVKGQIDVLEALPRILARHPDVVVLFAYPRHSETYKKKLDEAVVRLRLKQNTRWLGRLDSIAPVLVLSDIGLIASIGSEGWSRVAVEFAQTGKPVVSTTVGSLPEIVRHNETGLLVRPREPAEMADAVCRLLDDRPTMLQMGQRALEVSTIWTAERMADEVLAFYREVMDGRRR